MTAENPRAISDAMSRAEGRINRDQMDVSVSQKMAIMDTEKSIRGAIESYKQMGIYEGVKESFVDIQLRETDTPENMLANIAYQFDRLEAGTGESARQQINAVVSLATSKLTEIKKELGDAAGKEIRLEQQVEETYQRYLPEYHFDPSNISETVASIGEMLGAKPNVEKLQGYEVENDVLLAELRLSKNAGAYLRAKSEFTSLTGQSLESVKGTAAKGLESAVALVKKGATVEARSTFTRTFAAAMDAFKVQGQVISAALYAPQEIHTPEEAHEEIESHGGLLSEAEMAMMLDIMLNGVKDKNYFQQLFDAKTALDFYAGKTVDLNTLSPVERQAFALVNGMGKGAAAFVGFFAHPWEALCHIGAAGASLLKPSTYKNISHMTEYIWNNTSALEKNRLVGDVVGQLLGGMALGTAGSALLKSSALAGATNKLGTVARYTGTVEAAAALAQIANPILRAYPALARYGTRAAEIAEGMAAKAHGIGHKWDHLLHHAHEVHGKIDLAEAATINTAGVAHAAHDAMAPASLPKNLPIYAEAASAKADFAQALSHSTELGFGADDIYKLRSALKQLEKVTA